MIRSTSVRRIEIVLFDLDDTLHDDTFAYHSAAEEVAREVAAEHGIDALALKAAYIAEAEGFWHRLSPDDLKVKLANIRASMWQSALEHVGAGDDPELARRSAERYNAYRVKYFTLFPGAIDLLRALRERGIKLGIVTNGLSETEALDRALEDFGGPDELKSGLEATYGHRLLPVVIDKAMQWKERTMRARWLWATWAHLAVACVIVL